SPVVLYAFARSGYPENLEKILAKTKEEWKKTIVLAQKNNIIQQFSEKEIDIEIDRLYHLKTTTALESPFSKSSSATYTELLSTSKADENVQLKFMQA